jgi:hypothetical protein
VSDLPSAESAKNYRELANRLREQAAGMLWEDVREQFEVIARQYEILAEAIEKRLNQSRTWSDT